MELAGHYEMTKAGSQSVMNAFEAIRSWEMTHPELSPPGMRADPRITNSPGITFWRGSL